MTTPGEYVRIYTKCHFYHYLHPQFSEMVRCACGEHFNKVVVDGCKPPQISMHINNLSEREVQEHMAIIGMRSM